MLETIKDGRLQLPPLRGAFGILDRPCAPCPAKGVGTEGVPPYRPCLRRVEQKAADKEGSKSSSMLPANSHQGSEGH